MKKKMFIAMIVLGTFGFSGHLFAQETMEVTKQRTKTNNANEKTSTQTPVVANSNQCLVSLISNAGGCEIAFTNEAISPKDVSTGQASSRPGNAKTGTVSFKPSSFNVSSSDNSVSEIKSPRDVATGQSSGRSPGNPVGGLNIKGGKNPGGGQFNKLVAKNNQFSLPPDCPNGNYDLILSWSWGASNSGSAKTYCQCHFILTMQDGACVAIKTKGTGADKN